MKVLFLDIDGVCNSAETFKKDPNAYFPIDPYMAFLVGRIEMNTCCKVVLSSAWRHHPESVEHVKKRIVPIFDLTKSIPIAGGAEMCERGKEIKEWLDRHPEVTHYAILDDSSDMLPEQEPNFFKTNWQEGLTTEIAQNVITHLNRKPRNAPSH